MHTVDQLHDSERLHSSKTLEQSSVFRSGDEFSRHNDAIISNNANILLRPKKKIKFHPCLYNGRKGTEANQF